MFARDTFTSTFTGPITASGETLSQAKSQAGAQRSFAGNQRGYLNQTQGPGVRAGSRGSVFRSGLMSDMAAAQAGEAAQAQINRIAQDGQARDNYFGMLTEERDGLRRLLFDSDQTENIADNALQKDMAFSRVSGLQRLGDQTLGRRARKNQGISFLTGLL
jgi:hypothetical protein